MYICPNCNAKNSPQAKFCIECSQKTHLKLKSVWLMIFDFFANLIDYDSKLFSSIKGLFKPGFLTQQYLAKKRVSYLTPIRMFIIAMLSFFWILSQNGIDKDIFIVSSDSASFFGSSGKSNHKDDKFFTMLEKQSPELRFDSLFKRVNHEFEVSRQKQQKAIKKLKAQIEKSDNDPDKKQKNLEKLLATESRLKILNDALVSTQKIQDSLEIDKNKTMNLTLFYNNYKFNIYDLSNMSTDELIEKYHVENWLEKLLVGKFQKFNQDTTAFGKFIFQNLTWVVLIEILLMCIFYKLFYFKTKKKYVEHFIFNLNVRSWLFVIGSILFLTSDYISSTWMVLSIVFSVIIYLFMSLKRVYQQGYLMTTFKLGLLTFIELFVILISFVLVLLVSSLIF